MSFLREVTPWFAVTMLPLVLTSWKLLKKKTFRPLVFLFVATILPVKILCAINTFFFDCSIASFGQADTMAWALGHLTSKNPRFVDLEPNLRELFPDGGGNAQRPAWCQYAVDRGNILAEEWEENPSFRKSLCYQEHAFEKAKMRLENEMRKLFFATLLLHPVDCWEGTEASASFSLLTQHGPLFTLWREASSFSIYGIILCLIGFLRALRGGPSFFKKVPSDREALVQFSLLLHIVGFLLLYALSIGVDLHSVGHAVFLSGLLGWWSIVSGIKHWHAKRRADPFPS
jgi:hypothetical protein